MSASGGGGADRPEASPVLVLGMHRSGTSIVTESLTAMGFDAGRDPLMAATDENPTGLFEVERLTTFDDRVLDLLGGRWSAPPGVDPSEVAALASDEPGERARGLVAEIFTGPAWVWKDPRTCLLLPFWRAVLDPDPVAVVVLRNPLEVARSLQARNGIAPGYGLALWERYTRCLLRDLRGLPAVVVEFETAVADPPPVIDDVAGFLTDTGVAPEDLSPGRAAAVFRSGHRHQRATASDLAAEPAVTAEVRSLYATAAELRGRHRSFPDVDLGSETPRLQVAFDEHKRLSRHEERVDRLEVEVARRDEQIADLRREIARRSEHASSMVGALEAERDSLADRLVALESWWPVLTAMRIRRVLGAPTGRRDPENRS